jgi:hypothetical protein
MRTCDRQRLRIFASMNAFDSRASCLVNTQSIPCRGDIKKDQRSSSSLISAATTTTRHDLGPSANFDDRRDRGSSSTSSCQRRRRDAIMDPSQMWASAIEDHHSRLHLPTGEKRTTLINTSSNDETRFGTHAIPPSVAIEEHKHHPNRHAVETKGPHSSMPAATTRHDHSGDRCNRASTSSSSCRGDKRTTLLDHSSRRLNLSTNNIGPSYFDDRRWFSLIMVQISVWCIYMYRAPS